MRLSVSRFLSLAERLAEQRRADVRERLIDAAFVGWQMGQFLAVNQAALQATLLSALGAKVDPARFSPARALEKYPAFPDYLKQLNLIEDD